MYGTGEQLVATIKQKYWVFFHTERVAYDSIYIYI